MYGSGITLIEKTALVCEGDGILYGFSVWTNTSEETITIYDGLEADSGRKIENLGIDDYRPLIVDYSMGVCFQTGLYVVLSGNVISASIRFIELRKIAAIPEALPEEIIATLQK